MNRSHILFQGYKQLYMFRNRKLNNITQEEFTTIYQQSKSYADVCRALSLRPQGSNYRTIKKKAKKFNLPDIKYDFKSQEHKNKFIRKEIPLEQILTENSNYGSNELKKRLLKNNILQNICSNCGLQNVWAGKSLTLQLDHINGNSKDNRLDNLRLLCPNCHSQTSTFSGKKQRKIFYCGECNNEYSGYGKVCKNCYNDYKNIKIREKIIWPSNEELLELVWKHPMIKLSEILGVSDVTIKKRCLKHNICFPAKGYWLKLSNRKI